MGLRGLGDNACWICGRQIEEHQDEVEFEDFLPEDHYLIRYSDGLFHRECFDQWEEREEYLRQYQLFQENVKQGTNYAEADPQHKEDLLAKLKMLEKMQNDS